MELWINLQTQYKVPIKSRPESESPKVKSKMGTKNLGTWAVHVNVGSGPPTPPHLHTTRKYLIRMAHKLFVYILLPAACYVWDLNKGLWLVLIPFPFWADQSQTQIQVVHCLSNSCYCSKLTLISYPYWVFSGWLNLRPHLLTTSGLVIHNFVHYVLDLVLQLET